MGLMLGVIGINTMANAAAAVGTVSTDMGGVEMVRTIVDIGITPVLLLVFIYYFLSKAKSDDERVKQAYDDAQKKMEQTNELIAQREKQLMDESCRREELIRQEAESRETLIRKESEKRESILMGNMERMVQSMETITRSMSNIDQSLAKVNERLEKIEGRVNGYCDGE